MAFCLKEALLPSVCGQPLEGSSFYRCLFMSVSLQIIIDHVAGPQESQAWPDGSQAAGPEGMSFAGPTLPLPSVWSDSCSASGMSWLGEGTKLRA